MGKTSMQSMGLCYNGFYLFGYLGYIYFHAVDLDPAFLSSLDICGVDQLLLVQLIFDLCIPGHAWS